MATLQAARAHVLGLPLESAYSWGSEPGHLTRRPSAASKGAGASLQESGLNYRAAKNPPSDTYFLGDEMAFKADEPGELRFKIGGKAQRKEDFERQIEARFQGRFRDA